MKHVSKINELVKGDTYFISLLVTRVESKKTRAGKEYAFVTMTDGESDVSGSYFDIVPSDISEQFSGKVVGVAIQVGDYTNVKSMSLSPTQNISDFIKSAPLSSEFMYNEIIQEMESLQLPLKRVAIELYKDNKEKILRWGAAVKVHHNVYGGLLYHSYRMMLAAKKICEVYTDANRDLLEIGAVLHDIGKLKELNTQETGISDYTVDGNLQGHALLGVMMVHDRFQKDSSTFSNVPEEILSHVPEEDVRLLEHMIASHHGDPEFGAIIRPATIEAMLLNYLDLIDSRMYVYEDTLKSLDSGSVSEPIWHLDNTRIYKPVEN